MPEYRISIVVDGKDQASGTLHGIGGALSNMAQIAGGILGAGLFNRVADGLKSMAAGAFQATADFQAMQIGLESLVARELVAASATKDLAGNMTEPTLKMADALNVATPRAKELMAQIEKIAILSPFSMETVQGTFRQAMAFGYTSDEATKFTSAMLDVAAGTGASNEMLERMSYNLAQIRMVGKISAVDMRQLAMAGFDLTGVLRFVGRELKLNIDNYEDFNAALASGQVSWQQFTDLFAKYAKENFGGASERISRTLNGLKSTFGDLFMLTMPKLLGPFAEKFTSFANGILDQVMEIRESGQLEQWGEQIGRAFDWLEGAGTKVSSFIKKAITLAGIVSNFGALSGAKTLARWILPPEQADQVVKGIDDLQKGIEAGIGNIKAFWDENGPTITGAFEGLWAALTGGQQIDAGAVFTGIGDAFQTGTQWIKDNGPQIADTIKRFVDKLVEFGGWVVANQETVLTFLASFGGSVLIFTTAQAAVTTITAIAAQIGIMAAAAWPMLLLSVALAAIGNFLEGYGEKILGADAAQATFFQKVEVGFWGLLNDASVTVSMMIAIVKTKFEEATGTVKKSFEDMSKAISDEVGKATKVLDEIAAAALAIAQAFADATTNAIAFFKAVANGQMPDLAGGTDVATTGKTGKGAAGVAASAKNAKGAAGKNAGRAGGGPVYAGQSYLVGEEGPEIYTPNRNGVIIPNDETMAILNRKKDRGDIYNTFYITVADDLDAVMVSHKLADEMRYQE